VRTESEKRVRPSNNCLLGHRAPLPSMRTVTILSSKLDATSWTPYENMIDAACRSNWALSWTLIRLPPLQITPPSHWLRPPPHLEDRELRGYDHQKRTQTMRVLGGRAPSSPVFLALIAALLTRRDIHYQIEIPEHYFCQICYSPFPGWTLFSLCLFLRCLFYSSSHQHRSIRHEVSFDQKQRWNTL
jgi:hypothetical protein